MKQKDEKQQRIPLKYELIAAVAGPTMVIAAYYLAMFALAYLRIDLEKMSFFLAYRTLLTIVLFMLMIPLAFLTELVASQWRQRRFVSRNLVIWPSLLGIYLAITFLLLTILDPIFLNLSFIWQLPLAVACSSIGLIALAIVLRIKAFRKWLRNVGW